MAKLMFNKILVICTGNICRSPIAERIFRKEMPRKIIDSAGTGALVGHPADDAAIRIAQANDISLADHSGQQFTPSMARKYEDRKSVV